MSKILIVAEHLNGQINASTARCVTCARELKPDAIDVLVLSDAPGAVAAQAAKLDGVSKVLTIARPENAHPLAAMLAPQIAMVAKNGYSHVLLPSTTFGKDVAPRVAALLGTGQVSDIMSVAGPPMPSWSAPCAPRRGRRSGKQPTPRRWRRCRSTYRCRRTRASSNCNRRPANVPTCRARGGWSPADADWVRRKTSRSSTGWPTSCTPPPAPRAPRSMPATAPTTCRSARPARSSPPISTSRSASPAPSSTSPASRTPAPSSRSTRTPKRRSSRSPTLAWSATCSSSCRNWKRRCDTVAATSRKRVAGVKRLHRTIGLIAGLIVAALFAWYVVRSLRGHDLGVYSTPRAIIGIALAALCWSAGAPLLALAWRAMLSALGVRKSRRELTGSIGITQFAKYVPGNVAQYLGRVGMSLARGIPARALAVTLILETLLVVAAAIVVGVGTGALSEVGLQAVHNHGAQLALIAVLVVFAIAGLFLFRKVAPALLRKFTPRYAPALDGALLPSQSSLVRAFVLYCLMYGTLGLGL